MVFKVHDRIIVPNTVPKYMERGIDLKGKIGTIKEAFRQDSITVTLDDIKSPASGGGWFYLQNTDMELLKGYKLEEEVKMESGKIRTREIVELWYGKGIKKINDSFNCTKNHIQQNDESIIYVKDKIGDINLYLNSFGVSPIELSYHNFISKEGVEAEQIISECRIDDIDKLDRLKAEILAMLSACDRYEQEMIVLENYGIVVNGKLI